MMLADRSRSTRKKKNLSSATLSTTNPTRTDPAFYPGLRGERRATSPLSHDALLLKLKYKYIRVTYKLSVSNHSQELFCIVV